MLRNITTFYFIHRKLNCKPTLGRPLQCVVKYTATLCTMCPKFVLPIIVVNYELRLNLQNYTNWP